MTIRSLTGTSGRGNPRVPVAAPEGPVGPEGPEGPAGPTGPGGAGGGFSIETFHLMSTGSVAAIATTDTYGFLVYCATDLPIDAMVTEIQQLGAGAGPDLTMGIYDVTTGALLSSTGNVVPVLGLNAFALPAPLALARGNQYYFSLYCARVGTNFLRRAPGTVPAPGAWAGKGFGWRDAGVRFGANILAAVPTLENDPIWIAARTSIVVAVNDAAFIDTTVSGTPALLAPPLTGQELLALVDTVAIGGVSLVNLPAAPSPNSRITVKDSTGSAAINVITISGNGNLIDGAAVAQIASNFGAITCHFNGVAWRVL